ncbi:GIY-YIG nuclease family protein [Maribacter algicola]|uniref:GIY-YIG nuclease family protein n=1 Tax=Meishania litoralis TaxID=3434685 RepID=A0ACC7LQZ4_9FLAO
MEYEVYILFSEKLGRYYCGQTDNLTKRFATHNSGGKKYTSKGIPWKLIKSFPVESRSKAIELERKIKKRGIERYLDEN